jgi:hypothetical protein
MSSPPIPAIDLEGFVIALRGRLDAGAQQYGDRSFTRPLVEVIGEIEQELLDVSGWSVIAWSRLRALRAAVERTRDEGGQPHG